MGATHPSIHTYAQGICWSQPRPLLLRLPQLQPLLLLPQLQPLTNAGLELLGQRGALLRCLERRGKQPLGSVWPVSGQPACRMAEADREKQALH
jgi:hypothetical protein